MALVYPARLKAEIRARRARPSQQFGQANDYSTWGGATGCTHTVLQWLAWRVRGHWYTHDEVSHIAGYPAHNAAHRGMRPAEVQAFIDHVGIPYKVTFDLTALQVAHLSKRGPVGIAHIYGWWPEWKGYRYGTKTADGRPNGYATPTGHAGRTQLSGFEDGRHMGLLLGYATDASGPDLYYAWEPNHGSPARPEKPPYDRMSYDQFKRTYDSYAKAGNRPYAIVPTRTLP
jgi:hypothetical protein